MKNKKTIYNEHGIDYREVDNDKFKSDWFAPLSVYDGWMKSLNGIPWEDDLFYGYVDDEKFYGMTDDDFEKYVMYIFD